MGVDHLAGESEITGVNVGRHRRIGSSHVLWGDQETLGTAQACKIDDLHGPANAAT